MKKEIKIDNPALQFISNADAQTEQLVEDAAGFKGLKRGRKPSPKETKSKRLNLLVLPSTYRDIKKIATMEQKSVNDLVNFLLEDYILNNSTAIDNYNNIFGEREEQ